jgi:HAD superfamily hydrolase (TIGR01490 family)
VDHRVRCGREVDNHRVGAPGRRNGTTPAWGGGGGRLTSPDSGGLNRALWRPNDLGIVVFPHIRLPQTIGSPPIHCFFVGSAAFFDLDKTVIATSSTLAFGRPFFHGGLINRRAILKASYAQFVYLIAGADADQMDRMRDQITAMCAGWDVQQVNDIVAETLFDIVDPLIYDEAADLIEQHRAAGRDIVIVSSSGEEVVAPVGAMVGADRVVATRMVVEDGRYTGEIAFYAYGENKAAAIRELSASHGYDLAESYAYSDSVTDLPMLEVVGHATAVNPDRALRRAAVERGWPVLHFDRAVSVRSRLVNARQSGPAVAGTAVGIGAAAGLAWYARRRLRS